MPPLLAIVKYLCEATQLVIFRCTAFGSSYFSGPWWAVPVRKNIQVFLGKNPPCFQRMCLKPRLSEHSRYSSRQCCHQAAHKLSWVLLAPCNFLLSSGITHITGALWLFLWHWQTPPNHVLPIFPSYSWMLTLLLLYCDTVCTLKAHLSP